MMVERLRWLCDVLFDVCSHHSVACTTTTVPPSSSLLPSSSSFFNTQLFTNPTEKSLKRWEHGGRIAAYGHATMVKLHNSISDALDECLKRLEAQDNTTSLATKRFRMVEMERLHNGGVRTGTNNSSNVPSETNSDTTWTDEDNQMESNDAFYQIESFINAEMDPSTVASFRTLKH